MQTQADSMHRMWWYVSTVSVYIASSGMFGVEIDCWAEDQENKLVDDRRAIYKR